MDVIQERLEREFNIDLIMTAPSVVYHVNTTDGDMLEVSNPSEFPDPTKVASIEEPYVKAQIMVPQEFVGAVMELAQRKRGDFVTMDYIDENRVNVIYQIPLAEIVFDFFDKIENHQHVVMQALITKFQNTANLNWLKWIFCLTEIKSMRLASSFTMNLPMNVVN